MLLLSKYLVVMVLISQAIHGFAEVEFSSDYFTERNSLYSLKSIFNDPVINKNWTGYQCYTEWLGIECEGDRVTGIVLEDLGLAGSFNSDAFIQFSELSVLSLKNNSISGKMMNFLTNQKLTSVDLSYNRFYGPISPSTASLEQLESLQLQNNNFTGPIPEFHQTSLKHFNVSNNNLSGQIPDFFRLFGSDSFSGNLELCGPPTSHSCNEEPGLSAHVHDNLNGNDTSNPGPPASKSNKSSFTKKFAVLFLLFDIVALVAVILLFILYRKKAKELKRLLKEGHVREESPEEQSRTEVVTDRRVSNAGDDKSGKLVFMEDRVNFELSDLLKASAEGLGNGIFGNTYKAVLDDGLAVVVKRLRDLKPMTSQDFTRQLRFLASHNHPNLLPPLAYFYSKEEKLILYKFAHRGNLSHRIHGNRGAKDRIPFRWNARLLVARGVARALEYLHRNSLNVRASSNNTLVVPHGNLKPSNVLLNENDMVLVTDYGVVSLLAQPLASQRMVAFRSPEYKATKRLNYKSDIWSYGCLLLELLTGRASATSAPPGTNGADLCSWVHRAVREEWTAEIFDTEISMRKSAANGMLKLMQTAITCCDKSPEERPDMVEVVREVESIRVVESEDEDDQQSFDRSLTDESVSTNASSLEISR